MSKRLYWLIVVLMLGSIMAGACAASTPAPTTVPPAAAPTTAPQPAATVVTRGPGGFPVGQFVPDKKFDADWVTFKAIGTYIIGISPREIPGHYVVDGDKITLNEDSGICLDHPGAYHWAFQGNALTFTAIEDQCTASQRQEDFSGRSWILSP